ncbi:MAG TPA: AraC family transcriptional regulator [Marinagarivorans sp.]
MISLPKNIPVSLFPKGVLEFFDCHGVNCSDLLSSAGVSHELFNRADATIDFCQLAKIFHEGASKLGPGAGLKLGFELPWCFYGLVGEIPAAAPSLAAAGLAFRRYIPLVQPFYFHYYRTPDYYLTENQTLVCPIPSLALGYGSELALQFEFELRLATTLRLFAACGHKGSVPETMTVKLASNQSHCKHLIHAYSPALVLKVGGSTQISSPHAMFTEQWRPHRNDLFKHLLSRLELEYLERGIDSTVTGLVRWHICRSFIRQVTFADIAQTLNLSKRSLSRKLAQEQTSFREILHEVKMEIACRHICYSDLGLEAVAGVMGFSCGASLRRAIKDWTGSSPACLRRRYNRFDQTAQPSINDPVIA